MSNLLSDEIIDFIESLKLASGSYVTKPFILRDWQKRMIQDVYDPVDNDGFRIVRTALLSIARKNGKTEFTAALALAHMCLPGLAIANQQVCIIANDREQAGLMFRVVATFIRQDAQLNSIFNIADSKKTIEYKPNFGTLKVLPAVVASIHGLNPTAIFADEAGNWIGERGREIFNVLKTGFGAQEEPILWVLSTMPNTETHFFAELVKYGKSVNSGNIDDPTFKSFIYSVPEELNVFDMEIMKQANPALGDFRSLTDLKVTAEQASKLPANEAQYRQLFANQIVNTLATFISPSLWKSNGSALNSELEGKPCWVGFDLSTRNDLTSMVVVIPDDDGFLDVLPYFWKGEDAIDEHAKRDKVPYRSWMDQGFLETTPGATINYDFVVHRAAEILASFDVQMVAYDRWRIEEFKREMDKAGIYWEMQAIGQGYKDFTLVIDDFEEMLLGKKLRHANHPCLTWNASNTVIDLDPAGGRKFNKQKSYSRIDGMVALGMAIRSWKMGRDQGFDPKNIITFI
ncbi:MAG: terminase large subunit [gamma proteobacterium symbiont of Taylorina sp.]|nr:terminase large subunit [gamma proteobacterium symbiont of Taylorina sp.]